MNEFIEFLTSSEMIIVGVIAAVGCFLGLIVFIFEKTYYKRKQRHNTKELNNLVEDVSKEMEKEQIIEKVDNSISNVEKEKVTTIEEALSVAESIEEKIEDSAIIEKPKCDELIEVLEPVSEISHEEEKIENNNNSSAKEEVCIDNTNTNVSEEKPLVIPIEEFEASKSIEDIYSEVKEEVESLENNSTEELKYTDIEPNKEEAIAELKKVTENLLKKEEQEKLEPENIELTKFEEEQEENAIISMDELLRKSNELYEKNEVKQYEDEGNEPISLQDLEARMNNIKSEIEAIEVEDKKDNSIVENITNNIPVYEVKEPEQIIKSNKVVLDDFNTIDKSDKVYRDDIVFKSSPIISPIFGIEDNHPSNDMMLENTANYDKFDEEIKKTNEFIVTLKELQEKLD